MKLIRCDNEDIVSKVPNLFKKIEEYFGNLDVLIFVYLDDDNNMSFVCRNSTFCLLIDGNRILPFGLDDEYKLKFYTKEGYNIFPNGLSEYGFDMTCCNNKDGLIKAVISYPMEFEYGNGAFSYFQYDSKKDTMCEVRYRHHYVENDGVSPIYGYYSNRRIESLYLDNNYSVRKPDTKGFIPRNNIHMEAIDFEKGSLGYSIVNISEHGFVNWLMSNEDVLNTGAEISRYVRSFYIKKDGTVLEPIWPFCRFFTEDDIKKVIYDNDFDTEVPKVLLDAYNNSDKDINMLEEIIDSMNDVVLKRDNTKYLLLRRRSEDEDGKKY